MLNDNLPSELRHHQIVTDFAVCGVIAPGYRPEVLNKVADVIALSGEFRRAVMISERPMPAIFEGQDFNWWMQVRHEH